MQRAYWTLKQNLDKFKYNQVIKLNHLGHIKWHRRCKSLTFFFFFFFFVDSYEKKFRVGTFWQGRSCNRKHIYFFGLK